MRRLSATLVLACCLLLPGNAQESRPAPGEPSEPKGHLNPVIAKLVGALFLGAGSDLSRSMGVPASSPEVEAAFQQVLGACKTHKVACGITAGTATDIVRRVKEGWSIIRSTVPSIAQARTQLGDR